MSKGGMICRWSRDRLERREGEDFRMEESGQMAWELEGGVIVPVHRTTNLVGTKGGKRFYEHHGNVKFLSVSDEEVGPEELSVHRMGVVVGTPVVDQVMGLEYRYSQQGKFGDARQELPADLLANGNSVKAASGQHEPQEGDAGEHPTRVEPEDDGQTHQPKRPSTSMLYAIGLGLFLAILLGGYFAIRRLKRGT